MRAIKQLLTAYAASLSWAFQVSPDFIIRERRGNLPPPSGGIGAY